MKKNAFGWYNLCKFSEKWHKVLKIAPIFAISYEKAIENGLVEDEKLEVDHKNMHVDANYMICRDENFNLWAEKIEKFTKRYKKTGIYEDFWQKYEPTEKAINFARKNNDESGYDMTDYAKNGKKWEVTNSEFRNHYKKL